VGNGAAWSALELAGVSSAMVTPLPPHFLRERGGREGMGVSRISKTSPCRSCTSSALMSGARSGVWAPNGEQV